ncbi:MAG: LamG domain-containing protein, partial [Pirellulales bacterium]
ALYALVWIPVVAIGQEAPGPASANRSDLLLELLLEDSLEDTSQNQHACRAHGNIEFVEGRGGGCASFDGRSWIDTGLLQKDFGSEFTIECWVKPADRQIRYADLFGNHVSGGFGFVLQQHGANTNQFAGAYGAGGGTWVRTRPVPLAAGKWQHVALMKRRGEVRVYLDGIPVAVTHDPTPPVPSPLAVRVGLGFDGQDRCFQGRIADFRIWNRALTSFEHAGIAPEQKREALARVLRVLARPAAVGKSDSSGDSVPFEITIEEGLRLALAAASVDVLVELEAEWNDFQGVAEETIPLPGMTLSRSSGYSGRFVPPSDLKPGFYWVTCQPTMQLRSEKIAGMETRFSYVVNAKPISVTPVPWMRACRRPQEKPAAKSSRSAATAGCWRLIRETKAVNRNGSTRP